MPIQFYTVFTCLIITLQTDILYGQFSSVSEGIGSNDSNLPSTTAPNFKSSVSESASTATEVDRPATTAAAQSDVTQTHQVTQNTTTFVTGSSSQNANSSEMHTNWASHPTAATGNATFSTTAESSTANTTLETNITRNDSHNSTNTTSAAPTIAPQNTTTDSSNATNTASNISTTTAFINVTTVSASTNITGVTTNNASSTTMQNGSVSTTEAANTSLTTEHTSLTPELHSATVNAQTATESSFPPNTDGTSKEVNSNPGVVFGAVIGSILGVVLICLIAYFICGTKKSDSFAHRRLYEDIRNEPVLRLDDTPGSYDLSYGDSSYHNPAVMEETEYPHSGNTLDFIPMSNLPSNHPSA